MVVAAKAEEAVESVTIEVERVTDGVDVYLMEGSDRVVDCELEGVVDAVCEADVVVVAEEDLDEDSVEEIVLDFVRELVE